MEASKIIAIHGYRALDALKYTVSMRNKEKLILRNKHEAWLEYIVLSN